VATWRELGPRDRADRALSIGADGICMSIASTDDLNTAMAVAKDWHRRIYITRFSSSDSFRDASVTPWPTPS